MTRHLALSLLLALLLPALAPAAASAAAQGDGVTLLAKVDPGSNANDIWGYTAGDGREYALVGTAGGTAIYNCTVPTAPYLTGFINGPGSIWRDMKTYGNYAYVVTEGGGGMQIVDLSNPENPTLVKTWGANRFANAHNIAIDLGTGIIYVCGTNNGVVMFDAAANPTSPPHVTNYTSQYVHDLHVQNGYSHQAEIYRGEYRIMDISNLPSYSTKDRQLTPGRFTHSAWANESDTLAITTDEVGGGRVALYDITNKSNIIYRGQWTPDTSTIPHNAFIIGDKAYISWYTEGFICLDISDPTNPKKFGSFDTSPYSGGSGYHGAWGCYPFSPSGVVYISDIEEGFYILQVEGPAINLEHAELGNTSDEVGPYDLSVDASPVNAGASVTAVDCWYKVEGGSWQSTPMSQVGATTEWSGSIPGQSAPSIVQYYFHATESNGKVNWLPAGTAPGNTTYDFIVGTLIDVYVNDFEGATDEGWTHGAAFGTDDFERGTPTGKNGLGERHQGIRWYDPHVAFSGNKIWANDLGTGADDGAYDENSSSWLESPSIDCSNAARTTLVFQRWLSVEGGGHDMARIWVNNDLAWVSPQYSGEQYNVTDSIWSQMVLDISGLADGNADVKIRFELVSDEVLSLGGWGIDDVRVVALEPGDGTDSIFLTGPTSADAGTSANYSFTDAPANASYWALRSFSAAGSTQSGHAFDLGNPLTVITTGTTDGSGTGVFGGNLPPSASGVTVYLELAAVDGQGAIKDSNMVTLQIL